MKYSKRSLFVFDGKTDKQGGHSQWMSRLTKLDYLIFEFGFWKPTYDHFWYDGQHHNLSLGFMRIFWGGAPFKDIP